VFSGPLRVVLVFLVLEQEDLLPSSNPRRVQRFLCSVRSLPSIWRPPLRLSQTCLTPSSFFSVYRCSFPAPLNKNISILDASMSQSLSTFCPCPNGFPVCKPGSRLTFSTNCPFVVRSSLPIHLSPVLFVQAASLKSHRGIPPRLRVFVVFNNCTCPSCVRRPRWLRYMIFCESEHGARVNRWLGCRPEFSPLILLPFCRGRPPVNIGSATSARLNLFRPLNGLCAVAQTAGFNSTSRSCFPPHWRNFSPLGGSGS